MFLYHRVEELVAHSRVSSQRSIGSFVLQEHAHLADDLSSVTGTDERSDRHRLRVHIKIGSKPPRGNKGSQPKRSCRRSRKASQARVRWQKGFQAT